MILVELIESDGTINRLGNKTWHLEHQWPAGFVNRSIGTIGWSLPQQFGGMVDYRYGSFTLSPNVLPDWPPKKSYQCRIYYAKTAETDRQLIFDGYAHLSNVQRGSGASFQCFVAASDENVKIDSTGWGSINNDTLVNVISALCGSDYLQMTVDSTKARDSSPNVTWTMDTEMVVQELIDNLCQFYNHLAYIKDSALHLVSMFSSNGSQIDMARNIKSSEIIEYSPVSKISVTAGDDWDIAATTNSYGSPITITPYHDTEANALIELNLAKSIVESDIARVDARMAHLPSIPLPGQEVHWIDNTFYEGIEATIKARDVLLNLSEEVISITGDGIIGIAMPEIITVTTVVSTGVAWNQIVDNGETGFTSSGFSVSHTRMDNVYGTDYYYCDDPTAGSGKYARWTFTLPETGTFEILITWSSYSDRSTDAPFKIKDNTTLIATVDVDETANPGDFYSLGIVDFSSTTCVVEVTDDATDGTYLTADAVKVLKTSNGATLPVSGSRTYLLELDFEASPNWDSSTGTQDCNLDDDGDICDQYSGEKYAGSYSFGLRAGGGGTNYGAKQFSASGVNEIYVDYWQYVTPGRGQYYIAIYDTSNSTYLVSLYYNSGIKIYLNSEQHQTSWTPTVNQWEHYRIHVKRDTNGSNGVVQFWASASITDFDGETPYYSSTTANTYEADFGYVRARSNSGTGGYLIYYDDIKIWQPDGNE